LASNHDAVAASKSRRLSANNYNKNPNEHKHCCD
jgi:hypothetical protein